MVARDLDVLITSRPRATGELGRIQSVADGSRVRDFLLRVARGENPESKFWN